MNFEELFSNFYYDEALYILSELKLTQRNYLRATHTSAETFRSFKTKKIVLPFYLVNKLRELCGNDALFTYFRQKYANK